MADRYANYAASTRAVHADDRLASTRGVAPAMHVSTTYKYESDPDKLIPWDQMEHGQEEHPADWHIYSRYTGPNTTRFEGVLTSLLGGATLTYGSGIAAFHAMMVHLNPKRVAIGEGYHGCHGTLKILNRLNGLEKLDLDCAIEDLQPGDVIHVETPLNPTGEARDLAYYAEKARKAGAYLTVDATFAPPPLQDPLAYGADIVMHSGTKYFGGHSDLLCGTLTIHPKHLGGEDDWAKRLLTDRLLLGSVMGSMEGWLGLRSVRTLEVRVKRQSETATKLVEWLEKERQDPNSPASIIELVQHASLQPEAKEEGSWLKKQMPNGWGPVFSLKLNSPELSKRLPSKLGLFHHATSLGGVESLIEWRRMTDEGVDPRLLRVSIGVEAFEDLRDDLAQGFAALKEEAGK